jgi:hypothetical protein
MLALHDRNTASGKAQEVVSKLQRWESKSSVRTKPRRILHEQEAMGKVYFSPELVAITTHPLVSQLGPDVARELQVQHLYRYLDFTTKLELEVIIQVAKNIALGRRGIELPDIMREDAFKLCTDESHHAYFSDDLRRQVRGATGIVPDPGGTPPFLRRLRVLQRELPSELRPLAEVLFAVVSETLISSILSKLPKDPRVVTAVRAIVADHAEDEGRHSAYFSQLFTCLWPRLGDRQRTALGPLLPLFIRAFLEPDQRAIRRSLTKYALDEEQIRAVVDQTYPEAEVRAAARDASQVTLHLFRKNGLIADHRIADAFNSHGLAIDD